LSSIVMPWRQCHAVRPRRRRSRSRGHHRRRVGYSYPDALIVSTPDDEWRRPYAEIERV